MNRSNQKYSPLARGLHWTIAGLIVAQYVLAEMSEYAEDAGRVVAQLALLANHKSVGITILALALFRLIWRATHQPPALTAVMPKWQHAASSITHWLLYGFLFALPITGWLMSSAKSYSVSWFNLFVLPDFVAANEALADNLEYIHELLAEALFVIAAIHILAALKHYLVDKDGVMQRMASTGGVALFAITTLLVVTAFGLVKPAQTQPAPVVTQSDVPAVELAVEEKLSDLPMWEIDYQDSKLVFKGDQAGAPFEGQWQSWQAQLQFAPEALEQSKFDVMIDIASVTSGDEERDGYIVGEDFFDVQNHTQARFLATEFIQRDNQFVAVGKLTMKGITHDTEFVFSVTSEGAIKTLNGTAKLDRLAWNIGIGDWTDTSWVGQFVEVEVELKASVTQ